ncbi:MAG: group II intron reverse transcriptase domain-containing protein [Candidatus Vogelbacteria bacterium]|nr:group II intron reverse transcriptase domain-containing protein [Candidatus Vogelbacteria bacterium]
MTCWVLKCDIRKFFANIDHNILKKILEKYIVDENLLWLLGDIIESFRSRPMVGLPLGNLTSQLLINIYMNEFDQFMKHGLKAEYYMRYSDDFIILSEDRDWLLGALVKIKDFLDIKLKLELHPDKVSIKTLSSGVDFLGWVNFPEHRVLRTSTKKRMFNNIRLKNGKIEIVKSYLGLLSHGNTSKLQEAVRVVVGSL